MSTIKLQTLDDCVQQPSTSDICKICNTIDKKEFKSHTCTPTNNKDNIKKLTENCLHEQNLLLRQQNKRQQQQRWWRKRKSAENQSIDKIQLDFNVNQNNGVASSTLSPTATSVSNQSTELISSFTTNNRKTYSKSSLHSGSSQSALKIFKNISSRSSQRSTKAQIIYSGFTSSTGWQQQNSITSKNTNHVLKLIHVYTLTKETVVIAIERKCQVWDVFHCCCTHLGIDDDRLFGLALRRPSEGFGGVEDRPRHEYFFLDPEQKISKYVPKEAKRSSSLSVHSPALKIKNRIGLLNGNNLNASSKPVIVLYMRVRVYVRRIDMISCDVALKHYYLQLRENLIDQWSSSGNSGASEEACWELAALAILTDKGQEWRLSNASNNLFSFRAEQYFPLWVINARGLDYIQENMPKILQGYGVSIVNSNVGSSSALSSAGASSSSTSSPLTATSSLAVVATINECETMFQFCQEASRGPFALNCHLYGLRRQKNDISNNALLSITDRGIDMWDVAENGERTLLKSLAWNKMSRLSFDNKKITICGTEGLKLALYAETEFKARYLLTFCREVHQQLIQINTNFVLNRPPSSPLLPPGWGLERLIDSPISASLMRHFNNFEYINKNNLTKYPTYCSKTKEPLVKKIALLKETYKTSDDLEKNTKEKKVSTRLKRCNLGHISTPPPMFHKLILKRQNDSEESDSEKEFNKANEKEEFDKEIKKEKLSLLESKDLAIANEIEKAMNEVPSPPKITMTVNPQNQKLIPNISTTKASLPPCLKQSKLLNSNFSENLKQHQTNLSSTSSYLPSYSNNVYQQSNISNLNTQEILCYSKPKLQMQANLQQNNLNSKPLINTDQSLQKKDNDLFLSSQKVYTDNVHVENVSPALLKPPPQYSEAMEQLKKTNYLNSAVSNFSLKTQKHFVKQNLNSYLTQSNTTKQGMLQYSLTPQKNCQKKNLKQGEQLIPSKFAVRNLHNRKVDENIKNNNQNKRWSTVSNGIDAETLIGIKKQQEQKKLLQLNYQFQKQKVLNKNMLSPQNFLIKQSKQKQLYCSKHTNATDNSMILNKNIQLIQSENNNVQEIKDLSQNNYSSRPQRRYATRSPASRGINRVKSMPPASSLTANNVFDPNDDLNLNLYLLYYSNEKSNEKKLDLSQNFLKDKTCKNFSNKENFVKETDLYQKSSQDQNFLNSENTIDMPKNQNFLKICSNIDKIYELEQNQNAVKQIPKCDFSNENVSNTEKFKNYPMMKALWEARHDFDETSQDQLSEINCKNLQNLILESDKIKNDFYVQDLANNLNNQTKKDLPSYNQFYLQQKLNFKTPESNLETPTNGFCKNYKVLDLPPPPPYPQNNAVTSVNQTSSTCKKVSLVM